MPTKRRPGSENPSKVQPLSVREFFERFPSDGKPPVNAAA